jgi:hypothetical protein
MIQGREKGQDEAMAAVRASPDSPPGRTGLALRDVAAELEKDLATAARGSPKRPRVRSPRTYAVSTVLAFVLTMPTYAQENDAKKLFRQMEKKITAAKTIKVRIEKTWADPQLKSLKEVTTLVLGEGDKAFCELFTSGKGISMLREFPWRSRVA